MKYNENADYAKITSYISANESAWLWDKTVDFFKFENGKIYVNGNDTGLKAKDGEWYRIAIEEHYKASESRVFINGYEFSAGLTDWIFGNRWTQVLAGMNGSSESGVRDISVAVCDVDMYEGTYMSAERDKISYSVSGADVEFDEGSKTMIFTQEKTLEQIRKNIITDCEIKVIDSMTSNKDVLGKLSDDNVAVISSPSGKTLEYIYIKMDLPEPSNKPEPSEIPEPSKSPEPSASPEPSSTPEPSTSPKPSASPEPSESPKPDEFRCDDIKTYMNGIESNILSEGEIKAYVNMFVPSYMQVQTGRLIIAVYKDGVLQKVKMEEKQAMGETDFELTENIEETEVITVKAFFWDDNMKPYISAAELKSK